MWKKLSKYLGLALLAVGVVVCIYGFNTLGIAPWQSSQFYSGFAQMLLGISILIAGNGIINSGKMW